MTGFAVAAVLIVLNMRIGPGTEPVANAAANQPAAQASATAPAPPPEVAAPPADLAAPPSAEPTPAPTTAAPLNVTWAGRVDGGGATIAISAKGDQAVAYICDGKKVEAWLKGTAVDGRLELTGKDGAELTGSYDGDRAEGEVSVGDRSFTFDVAATKKPSGLYRATADVRGARIVGGWIVLPDGTQVGLATVAGKVTAVSTLDTTSGGAEVGGTPVTGVPVDGRF
ncbi:hypothetical protein O7627_09365 [Solwaraspora sp. WMMD1047]|uniref:hypothetical protein n=1 Tax=Solwaraspora sp. WMMD1047 TaxID=3016102 RepID=UPI0024167994|nr:hypothetical protein [Solwaraspora sp. WMMD1047]MDG4829510.1 hypothetical protein [Solwaraspora sp. WMMD1047]